MKRSWLAALGLVAVGLPGAAFSSAPAVFTVTSVNDSGAGTLRQAILDSNGNAGVDTITFNIPGSGLQTIVLASALPDIVDPVVIDARTQPGYLSAPVVEVNGAAVTAPNAVMTLSAGGSTIQGLAITRGQDAGLRMQTNGLNVIEFCGIGAIDENSSGLGNGGPGVDVVSGAIHTLYRNRIAFNGVSGIVVRPGASRVQYTENLLYSNTGPEVDLGGDGRTGNDVGDVDAGANTLLNFPVVDKVTFAGGGQNTRWAIVSFHLDAAPTTQYDVFAVFGTHGENPDDVQMTFMTTNNVTSQFTDGAGHLSSSGISNFPEGAKVIALVTRDLLGNMSELSVPIEVPDDVVLEKGCGACGLEGLLLPALIVLLRRRRR